MEVVRDGVPSVVIAVATREDDNANFHELLDYRTRVSSYAVTGAAAFLRGERRFSTGGVRSLFFSAGITMDSTNFFSPWSSNLIIICSSVQFWTEPKPNLLCSICAPVANAGLLAMG